MSHVRRVAVPLDVADPFVFRRVGVARADVARLQRFELLLGAEFVGLGKGRVSKGGRGEGGEGGMGGGGEGAYHVGCGWLGLDGEGGCCVEKGWFISQDFGVSAG